MNVPPTPPPSPTLAAPPEHLLLLWVEGGAAYGGNRCCSCVGGEGDVQERPPVDPNEVTESLRSPNPSGDDGILLPLAPPDCADDTESLRDLLSEDDRRSLPHIDLGNQCVKQHQVLMRQI